MPLATTSGQSPSAIAVSNRAIVVVASLGRASHRRASRHHRVRPRAWPCTPCGGANRRDDGEPAGGPGATAITARGTCPSPEVGRGLGGDRLQAPAVDSRRALVTYP